MPSRRRTVLALTAAIALTAGCTSPPPAQTQPVQEESSTASRIENRAITAGGITQPDPHETPTAEDHSENALAPTNTSSPAPTQPDTPATEQPASAPASPDEIALEAAALMYTSDTATDASPIDAQLRAASHMTPDLAAAIADAPPIGGGAWWNELAAHQGTTTATARLAPEAGQPPDTPTTAHRSLAVEIIPTGTDGWQGGPRQLSVRLVLTRPSTVDGWRISDLTTT